jgi:hypothetical protein
MKQQDRNGHELEKVLTKHLASVAAPENLWAQVQSSNQAPRTAPMWLGWAAAAAAIAVSVGGWAVWQLAQPPLSVEARAVNSLEARASELPLHTQDATTVRKWIKAESGIDVPLPPKHDGLVQILGARISEGENPTAEIAYQVGEYRAALLVAKDPTGKTVYPSHEVRSSDPFQKARVSSWSMRGQTYTLAWSAPGEFRVACLLCHSTTPPPSI